MPYRSLPVAEYGGLPTIDTISPFHPESVGIKWQLLGGTALADLAPAAYPAASLAICVPFILPKPITISELWWWSGPVASGNADCGVYDPEGNRIVSAGSTVQTTGAPQAVAVSARIPAGYNVMVFALDNVTGQLARGTLAVGLIGMNLTGIMNVDLGATWPLPATLTFAAPSQNYLPLFGLSQYALV